MSNHQKRLSVPNSWPVERKTQTFTVKADAGPHGADGVPLLIVLRDVLGYVDSRKEARYALDQDQILINGTPESDESRPVGMFDILAFTEREEYYRVFPGEGGRLALTAIDAEAAESKLGKIVGKQHVSGGDVQLTLHDGHTLLVEADSEYTPGDSIVIANEDDEIVAHFEYEEGALVTAVNGQHAGEIGEIEEIQVTAGSSPNNVLVAQEDGDGFETIDEYVVVIDENFTGDSGTESESASGETASDEEDEQAAPEADAGAETPDEADDADADSEQTDDEDEGGDDE
ncbi:30S ribosomal protein S4e [Halapricum desulfuricans]|uniref:Small ribosomal subunit protein eS4 n=1 Tax=Halapricum desulfuricans TaxID=2841257 RepID=A0A897N3Y4_9EURY|nr:30S ribosomal protein S4e [Halapricum desulfuricans]QSG05026.1 Ribosomal protein S4E [Halapricum desulfuricans]